MSKFVFFRSVALFKLSVPKVTAKAAPAKGGTGVGRGGKGRVGGKGSK